MRTAFLVLVAVVLTACSASFTTPLPRPIPSERATPAEQVLGTVATAAGSLQLVRTVAAYFGRDLAWLSRPEAQQIAIIVREHAELSLVGIRAAREDEWNGTYLVPAGDIVFAPKSGTRAITQIDDGDRDGLVLIVNGVIDTVQGSLIEAHVQERDPVGYAIGCGGMEHGRSVLTAWVVETGADSDGRVQWPEQLFDPSTCREQLGARADALVELARTSFEIRAADPAAAPL